MGKLTEEEMELVRLCTRFYMGMMFRTSWFCFLLGISIATLVAWLWV